MLLGFLLVLLVLVCIALTTVILLQRSEGGALGMGGGPSGFMSARGAGDLLTRTTGILAGAFFLLCLLLTILSGRAHTGGSVVDRLKVQGLNPDAMNRVLAPAPAPAQAAGQAPAAQPQASPASQFEAPRPEVHTAPAGSPAAQFGPPPTSTRDSGAHAPSNVPASQPAPQSTPTVAPAAAAPPAAPTSSPAAANQSAPKQ
jgi:preprotein translocase subunit SecG